MTQPPDSADQPSNEPTPPSYPTDGASGQPASDPHAYPPPPGAYPPGAYPPPGYAVTPPPNNQLAMWSMIVGIIGAILGLIGACGVVAGPIAIGLSIGAKNQIKRTGGQQRGAGMATAGLVLGIIGTALSVMWIILIATGVLELPTL